MLFRAIFISRMSFYKESQSHVIDLMTPSKAYKKRIIRAQNWTCETVKIAISLCGCALHSSKLTQDQYWHHHYPLLIVL